MKDVIERAKELREVIEKAMEEQDDKTASEAPELYRKMKYGGELIKAGTKINWKGEVKKAGADLWDREENDPDNAPNLWSDLDFVNGIRVISAEPSAEKAFNKGEKGFWKKDGKIYASLIDANVYTPETYSAGWEAVL